MLLGGGTSGVVGMCSRSEMSLQQWGATSVKEEQCKGEQTRLEGQVQACKPAAALPMLHAEQLQVFGVHQRMRLLVELKL